MAWRARHRTAPSEPDPLVIAEKRGAAPAIRWARLPPCCVKACRHMLHEWRLPLEIGGSTSSEDHF